MNKLVNIVILVLLALFISFRINVACNQLAEQKKTEEPKADMEIEFPAFYSGVLPCASCPGIQYTLILKEGRYEEISGYIDREPGWFTETGIWTLIDDTLRILDNDHQPIKTFLYLDNALELLNREENRVETEHNQAYRLEKSSDFRSIYQHHQQLKEEKDVKLVASGNEPFWAVHLSRDDELLFQTPGSSESYQSGSPEVEDGVVVYRAESKSGEIVLQLDDKYCQDSMSGYLFTHTASITISGRKMTGCASFLD
jgi:uncharacterized membrane protein